MRPDTPHAPHSASPDSASPGGTDPACCHRADAVCWGGADAVCWGAADAGCWGAGGSSQRHSSDPGCCGGADAGCGARVAGRRSRTPRPPPRAHPPRPHTRRIPSCLSSSRRARGRPLRTTASRPSASQTRAPPSPRAAASPRTPPRAARQRQPVAPLHLLGVLHGAVPPPDHRPLLEHHRGETHERAHLPIQGAQPPAGCAVPGNATSAHS
jgi:hypothetical protein